MNGNSKNKKEVPIYSYLIIRKDYLSIYKRADFKCEICGRNNCRLNVHHKDKNHQNNVVENMILVCSRCHADFHIEELKKGRQNQNRKISVSFQRKKLIWELTEQGMSLSQIGKMMGLTKQRVHQIQK